MKNGQIDQEISFKFETKNTLYTISDENDADIALLLVPAPPDEFDDGWFDGHVQELIRKIYNNGIKYMVICINKMDAQYADYSQGRYSTIKNDISAFITDTGFDINNMHFIPVSAEHGDNLFEISS